MPALDLLVKMQTTRTHMALVIDEYGGTDGLASIEDVVEMIVGDIEDEHDESEAQKIHRGADGTFVVDSRASLDDVSEVLGADLSTLVDAEDVDTLGGLITSLAGHVPLRGETLTGRRIPVRGSRRRSAPGEAHQDPSNFRTGGRGLPHPRRTPRPRRRPDLAKPQKAAKFRQSDFQHPPSRRLCRPS